MTAATWPWYSLMNAVLQGQHAVNPPLVVASATPGGVVSTPASTSTAEEEAGEDVIEERRPGRKRKRESDLMDFLKERAEREDEREREALVREEERERAAADRAERYLSLFERLINKF